jgi:predicted transcriptional regulator
VREILDFLVQRKFIFAEVDGNSTFYQITPKGMEVLNYFTKAEQLLYP